MRLPRPSLSVMFLRLQSLGLAAGLSLAESAAAESSRTLVDAAERRDWKFVREHLQRPATPGSEVHAAQNDGMTALHWAVHHGDLDTAQRLIQAGAAVQATNHYGIPPLVLACSNGDGQLTELLLEAGANANTTVRGGETVLMTAARTGRSGPVEALLARGANVHAKERRGQTALMWASAEGHVAVVERLLRAGADFRIPLPDSGFNAWFFAIREGRTDVVKALLQAGADINQAMMPGKPTSKGPRKGLSPLLLAVENGHFELATVLLAAGADPNDQRSGFTALHALTWVRKPNRGDGDDGDPPPLGSGDLSSLQFVRRLVEQGAQVNTRLTSGRSGKGVMTRRGATPFLLAAATADTPYLRLLLELGADATLPNAENCTPLMAASGVGTLAPTEEAGTEPEVLETLELLLSRGADLDAVDDHGETAMHGAAYKSLPKAVAWLANHGAKIEIWNRPNQYGWTPLRIAEGYRVGNFKPSTETLGALHQVLRAAGLTPPVSSPPAKSDLTGDYTAPISKPRRQPTPPP